MVDIAAITVAIISLLASVITGVATAYVTVYADKRKDERETEKLLRKYRDPLLLAAQDLQARLFNILDLNILSYINSNQECQDTLIIYTAFLLGQYFSWVYILRRQAQFNCFATEDKTRTIKFIAIIDGIKAILNTDKYGSAEGPFMLWKDHQAAIGELMSVRDADGELFCMGFSEFTQKWKNADGADDRTDNPDVEFRRWFSSVNRGIHALVAARHREDGRAGNRMRRVQHMLLDLADELDPKGLRSDANLSSRVHAAPKCPCSVCGWKELRRGQELKVEAKTEHV